MRLTVECFTGKSIRMLCYFQDFQAESSPVLSEADVEECLTWHVWGLYLLCDNCDVQYFYRVREEQLRLYLIFTNIKMHMYGKQSTLKSFSKGNYLYLLSSFSGQNISKFLSPSNHSFPRVPPRRIKITLSRWRETGNKSITHNCQFRTANPVR